MRKRHRMLILAAAMATLAAAVAVVLARSVDEPFELDVEWGAPSLIDVGADGDPVGALTAGLAAADGLAQLGPLQLDPEHADITAIGSQGDASAAVSGAVPVWFPVLEGGLHVRAVLEGEDGSLVNGAPAATDQPTTTSEASVPTRSHYKATQLSLIATSRTIDEVAADVTSELDDTWSDVVTGNGGSGFDLGVRAGPQGDLEAPNSLHVEFATSSSLPGLVLVSVAATYAAPDTLRPLARSFDGTGADVAALADGEGWAASAWSASDGVNDYGIPHRLMAVTWTAGEREVKAVADDLVARLGYPDGGNVDESFGTLTYIDGAARLERIGETTSLEWTSEQVEEQVDAPGPLVAARHGVPVAVVNVDARPLDVGPGEYATADAAARFAQAGMIVIDGAVALDVESGVDSGRNPGPVYSHNADQLVVVDTPLSAGVVADRLRTALAELGVEDITEEDAAYYVDDPVARFSASAYGSVGNPRYRIEVGSLRDRPGLVAVWTTVRVEFERPPPDAPVFAADYFAEPRSAANETWTPTRWYLIQGREREGDGVLFRGELDWVGSVPGPDGLRRTVAELEAITGVDPDPIAEHVYWFESADDWVTGFTLDNTYEPVTVAWEGGYERVS